MNGARAEDIRRVRGREAEGGETEGGAGGKGEAGGHPVIQAPPAAAGDAGKHRPDPAYANGAAPVPPAREHPF